MPTPFTDEDLEAAVAAGVISAEKAAEFRAFVERQRNAPLADDEAFRLLTGFNDIFVAIAIVMVLAALGWLAVGLPPFSVGVRHVLAAALLAAASWGLAEFFTRRRRMALPSLLLLIAFVGASLGFALSLTALLHGSSGATFSGADALLIGAFGVFAAWLHWRRFMVPITVAAGVAAAAFGVMTALGLWTGPDRLWLPTMAMSGLLSFGLAMGWDISDRERKTRRADVAFWLHLLAAPLIVHPAFAMLGLTRSSFIGVAAPAFGAEPDLARPALALALYIALALMALVVDRRALMVSALAYLLYAMNAFFHSSGALTTSLALSALIVGAGLLTIAAFWSVARRHALKLVPAVLRARLPAA